jgi:hypothetical protein
MLTNREMMSGIYEICLEIGKQKPAGASILQLISCFLDTTGSHGTERAGHARP